MVWPFHHKAERTYWLKVFGLYAATEASIQFVFLVVLNTFSAARISIVEFHLVMLLFQCLLIWPIWWVARSVRNRHLVVQILINLGFYVGYSFFWFGPVQDSIGFVYNHLQGVTRPVHDRQVPYLDRGYEYSYLNYQMLKHGFRLSWYYLAAYFYNYRLEENQRLALAVANKELQLKMLKWHLNPSFYFKTINHLQQAAQQNPAATTGSILQLAKVMEYVIYETKEKLIPVKKELLFLMNYIQLLNQQEHNFYLQLEVNGECDRLKISPLLLAGLIDRLVTAETNQLRHYEMRLQFQGDALAVKIEGGRSKNPLQDGDGLLRRRLTELYPEKFSIEYSEHATSVKIRLDEES